MTDDLKARLQQHLGGQYRLERELGGGGMSRVFLAEETALGRRVVIKVLPSEMAAVLSPERFQREVRLAAALQHPHIVPLLAAGKAGEVLYYTMPFLEGESLRSRLDRVGPLPVPDAIRLLREVADALGYAHRQGIIHRDIKPDNVLLSEGHAVVTDFGIAKALTEAGGTGALTATGVSVGTAAYMAPEQAAGESGVDQRADLYALGVMAYELLAGEAPFRGPTAQAIIAAHMTRVPAPITEIRSGVPQALAAAVARCLEKLPADRYQSAPEFIAALDTPTSGATAATAAFSPAQRTWPLVQILGLFALAAASVLGVSWGLRSLLGLPDWFFPAAAVLMALGLPVLVAATLVHNRRAAGTATPAGGVPAVLHRRLTLVSAVRGGVLALAGLGIVTAAYMALRLLGIGPVGSLVASGKLSARERLIIADFGNQTRDPALGAAVTQAFRVDFSQSKLVSPVEPDYIRRILVRMQRPDSTPLTPTVAREIAQRQGWKAVVAGELQQVGPSLLVSAQVVNAESGEVLATARETAKDSTGILDAVDRVSKGLRERIGDSFRTLRASAPLADVTTGSLEALRKYSEALKAEDRGDDPRAIALLEEAVAIDSTFAMAWRKLGITLGNSGRQPVRRMAALANAFRLRDRLTFRERKLTENSYYSEVVTQADSSIAALQTLQAEYPDDGWAANNLGVLYETTGRKQEALEQYQLARRLEPENSLAWGNIYTLQIQFARFDSAAATLAEMKQRFPPGSRMDMRETLLPLGRRDFPTAERMLRDVAARYQTNPGVKGYALRLLGGALGIQGKLAESRRILDQVAELDAARGEKAAHLVQLLRQVPPLAMFKADRKAAAARLDEILKSNPPERLAERERPMFDLIEAAVTAGQEPRAKALLAEFERVPGSYPARVLPWLRAFARGEVLSMQEETLPQALDSYRKAESFGTCYYCFWPAMASAFDRAGLADSALDRYQRWADLGEDAWEPGIYNFWAPVAWFRMGELYAAKADKDRATLNYGRFVANWKDADPELQPRVKEAKRRIAELVGEPRRP